MNFSNISTGIFTLNKDLITADIYNNTLHLCYLSIVCKIYWTPFFLKIDNIFPVLWCWTGFLLYHLFLSNRYIYSSNVPQMLSFSSFRYHFRTTKIYPVPCTQFSLLYFLWLREFPDFSRLKIYIYLMDYRLKGRACKSHCGFIVKKHDWKFLHWIFSISAMRKYVFHQTCCPINIYGFLIEFYFKFP